MKGRMITLASFLILFGTSALADVSKSVEEQEVLAVERFLYVTLHADVVMEPAHVNDIAIPMALPRPSHVSHVESRPFVLFSTGGVSEFGATERQLVVRLLRDKELVTAIPVALFGLHEHPKATTKRLQALVPLPAERDVNRMEIVFSNDLLHSESIELNLSCNHDRTCTGLETALGCSDCEPNSASDGVCMATLEGCDPDCQTFAGQFDGDCESDPRESSEQLVPLRRVSNAPGDL